MSEKFKIKLLIAIYAITIAMWHIQFPQIFDSIVITTVTIAAIIWFLDLNIDSIEFPFGIKGKFKNVKLNIKDGTIPKTFGDICKKYLLIHDTDLKIIKALVQASNHINSGDIKTAIKYIEEVSTIEPNDINLHIMLSAIYGEMIQDKKQAIYHCKKALEIDPHSIDANFNLALYTNHLYGSEQSLPIFEKTESLILRYPNLINSQLYGKLNIFIGHDIGRIRSKKEAEGRYKKAMSILRPLAEEGDKVSEFWLKDAERNLNAIITEAEKEQRQTG